MNGLTAKSPGIQANQGLCLTACARAEVGWGRESGCGIGVMDVTDTKCKTVSAKFKSRPRQILLGNFLATFFDSELLFSILSSFSESEPLSKLAHFWHIFTIFKLHS